MINPKTGERELCYVVKIDNVLDMEGVNNQIAVVNGWTIFVKRDSFKPGDLAIYFEIDSKVPATEQFEFLSKYNYAIKTQKYVKGKVTSQGLLMHPGDFRWDVVKETEDILPTIVDNEGKILKEGDFLTEKLGVTYYEPEDNKRKENIEASDKSKLEKMLKKWSEKHKILSKIKFIVNAKRKKFIKEIKSQSKSSVQWPSGVAKTDEERAQNMPKLFNPECELHNLRYIATEKLDGTSTTFTIRRKDKYNKKKELPYEYYVCSRNRVCLYMTKGNELDDKDPNNSDYLSMNDKYGMRHFMEILLERNPEVRFITVQGETYGTVQKRKYKFDHKEEPYNHLALFNIIFGYDDGQKNRLNPVEMKNLVNEINAKSCLAIETVPIVVTEFNLPDTCAELLEMASGPSAIDGEMREGLVFRSEDGKISFKAVSNDYLVKFHQ